MEEYGFKWKVDKKNKKIESHPYCPEHQIKLKLNRIIGGYIAAGYKYNIYCQICKKNLFENYYMDDLRTVYNLVCDKYEAIKNKHNKGF